MCDLQGATSADGKTFFLTSPVVLSRHQDYGVADLGKDGLLTFFAHHTCNRYCDPEWKKPNVQQQTHWNMQKSTKFRVRLGDGSDDESFIRLLPLPPPPEQPEGQEDTDSDSDDSEEEEEEEDDIDLSKNVFQEEFDVNDLDDSNEIDGITRLREFDAMPVKD